MFNLYRHLTFTAYLAVFASLFSISTNAEEWSDPEVFRINKEPARSFFYSYTNPEQIYSLEPWSSENHQLLNGKWKFKWVETPLKKPKNFFALGFDDSRWDEISVPGNWEINGYGTPFYHAHHCFKPKAKPPEMPIYYNPVGSYRQKVTIPEEWDGRQIYIHFGAVKSAFYIWVNGKKVGYSQDSKTAAEFDITQYVTAGENEVALEVYRYSDGSYFECQDMWRLSGIERDVYLYTTPKVHVRDYHAYTTLTDNYTNGLLEFKAIIENKGNKPSNSYRLNVILSDQNNNQLFEKLFDVARVDSNKNTQVSFSQKIDAPRLWSAESPSLYNLQLTLIDSNDQAIEHIGRKIGFRSTELKNGNILVNGKAIYFKGVNRHEHDPVSGHVISRESMLKDVQMMKEFNINAIRMSHYPSDPYIYHLADKYGLYVMDEANIESHGIGAANQGGSYNPANHLVNKKSWQAAYIDRISNMYERSKNNPSVVIRSLGNESGDGINLEVSYDWLKNKEPNTPVMSEQAQLRRHTDAYGQMYGTIPAIQRYATAEHDPTRPVILIEYEHAMGNSLGNFKEYWQTFEKYDALQGGFIWDWVDQTFAMKTLEGTPYWAYGGDLEPAATDTSMSFSANGLVYADRTPYPYLWEVKKVHQNVGFEAQDIKNGVVNITNKNFFISLEGKSLSWNITANGVIIKQGLPIKLTANPQGSELVQLDYQVDFKSGVEYFLNLEVKNKHANGVLPSEHVVAWSQLTFPYQKASSKKASKKTLSTFDKSTEIKFSGSNFSAKIDKKTGLFSSLIFNKKELLKASPRPSFWRAPTDNDLPIKDFNSGFSAWQKAGKNMALTSLSITKVSKYQTQVEIEHALKSIGSRYFTTYNIFGNGEIKVDVYFYAAPHKRQSSLPRIGTLFQLDKQFSNVTWFGRGPHENYWDRKDSAHVGLYNNVVEGLYVPYVRPQENGFRTDVRYVAFHNEDGNGIVFEGEPLLGFGAQYYSTDDYDSNKNDVTSREMHPHNLTKKDKIFVNIDYRQRGVGGTNSWGAKPLFDYTLPWLDYKYSYTIKPFAASK
ncbi:glycoside hydrolase family 2 TIM barrel-domain containing protein [Thalassotalea sp. ND16A]|uniref:glycoside hydrolase family 2 TIM barrel-domain containing protein n=1 Tax=Thalassotalea sp. ND16A TaxID=1535422 RepID=UPI00051A32E3|nr:glycoside hydrolase family 2 TIM barrel-domain containing protein [Thalassotalea sp. ND16A]KGK00103.1 hypothetical protein ND16A_0294 [Thalassotalea sp. ND16A]